MTINTVEDINKSISNSNCLQKIHAQPATPGSNPTTILELHHKIHSINMANLWIIEKLRFCNLHHSKYDNYAVQQKYR